MKVRELVEILSQYNPDIAVEIKTMGFNWDIVDVREETMAYPDPEDESKKISYQYIEIQSGQEKEKSAAALEEDKKS